MWRPEVLHKAIRYSAVWGECSYLTGSTRTECRLSTRQRFRVWDTECRPGTTGKDNLKLLVLTSSEIVESLIITGITLKH